MKGWILVYDKESMQNPRSFRAKSKILGISYLLLFLRAAQLGKYNDNKTYPLLEKNRTLHFEIG